MRLIDAEALISLLRRKARSLKVIGGDKVALRCFGYIIRKVEDAPTIDAVPVVHGRWIEDEEVSSLSESYYCNCSECETAVSTDDITSLERFYPYCPNCGAKMDKED